MPSTLVHALLPTSCLLASRPPKRKLDRKQWALLIGLCFILGNLPDLDLIPAMLFYDHFQEIHRALGHNFFSLVGFSYLGGRLFQKYFPEEFKGWQAYFTAACLVFSHVIFDASHYNNDPGFDPAVPLFWPFSAKMYVLPFRVFGTLSLGGPPPEPLTVHFFTLFFWKQIFYCEIVPSLLIFCLWFSVIRLPLRLFPKRATAR